MVATIWDGSAAPDVDPRRSRARAQPRDAAPPDRALAATSGAVWRPGAARRLRAALPHASVAHSDDPEAARDADIAVVVRAADELVERVNAAQPRTIAVVDSDTPVPLPWLGRVPAVLLGDPGTRSPTSCSAQPSPGAAARRVVAGASARARARLHDLGVPRAGRTTVRLVNAGTRRGREVVQLYAGGRLAGFAVVEADAGEEVVVRISVAPDAHDLAAGRSAGDLRVR